MSNFDFLKDFDEGLWKNGNTIDETVPICPGSIYSYATPFLQRVLEILLSKIGKKYDSRKDFYDQLDAVRSEDVIDYNFKDKIYGAYLLRNKLHSTWEEMDKNQVMNARQLHKQLFYISKRLYLNFSDDPERHDKVPTYKPIDIDISQKEVELIDVPDFFEIVDFKYDYCVICGEPNHSSYSLCCPRCNDVMDSANNFISIRNYFGKDAQFKKEDLIEYGLAEGHINHLINHLVRIDMLKVKGIYYSFNNMYFDEYLDRIDKYISVCELITKFREDKITPSDIKLTQEYIQGSRKDELFYQFYKIINIEVVNKFERELLMTEDIWRSIDYTTINQDELQRWYLKNLSNYKKGNINESFVVFNDLLKKEYIDLKRQGNLENDIKKHLNISSKVYEFWSDTDKGFVQEIEDIKRDLILKAIDEHKTREEIIEIAGVTPLEYDNIVKVSNFKGDELSQKLKREFDRRKEAFVNYLKSNDLETSCNLAKFSLNDFYEWYDKDTTSDFYINTTKILMEKYLDERRSGKTKVEAINSIGIKEKYVNNHWLKRKSPLFDEFQNNNIKVIVDLCLKGFKDKKSKIMAAKMADITVDKLNYYLTVGDSESSLFHPLFEYYENEIIPLMLSKFIKENDHKSMRKALESSGLSQRELDRYYELGKSGDEKFKEFHDEYLEVKKATYVYHRHRKKSHKICMRESMLSQEEFDENKDDIEKLLRLIKFDIVIDVIMDNKTSNIAASKANCSVDEIYEWYFKGRDGDEDYVKFYNVFHGKYVRPNINSIEEKLGYRNQNLETLVKINKENFTKKDVEIWVKNGLLQNHAINLDDNEDDDKKDKEDRFDANEMLREMGVEDYDKISIKKSSNTSSILANNNDDVEKLKKQILKK